MHSTSTYACLCHHPSFSPPPPLEMENATRLDSLQELRTRVDNNDSEVQSGAEEVFTAPAILERRRSDVEDHTGDLGPPAQIIIRQPMSEISPPRRRRRRRPQLLCLPNSPRRCARTPVSAERRRCADTRRTSACVLPAPAWRSLRRRRRRATHTPQRRRAGAPDPCAACVPIIHSSDDSRTIDGGEQHNVSSAESWQSSAETEVGETASARVPVVMESARSPYGRQVCEAFPVTAHDAATRGPSDPGDQAETDDFDSAPLAPRP